MTDTDWITVGRPVCITGYGEAGLLHQHTTIERITRTLIVCMNGRRYRIEGLSSVPYQPYSGTNIHPTCQRNAA